MTENQEIDGYRELAELLVSEIESGRYKPGYRLPGEIELSRQFSINRHTVGAAMRDLVQRDYIYRIQGKGTYVSHRKVPYSISSKTRFSTTISSLGLKPGASLMTIEDIPADSILSENLAVRKGERLTRLDIVRTIENIPVAYSRVCLPARIFPDLKARISEFHSLYDVLEKHYGVADIRRDSSIIEVEMPNEEDMTFMNISPNRPILVVSSLAKDSRGLPVEYCVSRCRGDLYKLHVDIPDVEKNRCENAGNK